MSKLDLKFFVGTHVLSGIGREVYGDSERFVLRLDDELYLFTGSGDDYRDEIAEIERVDTSPMSLAPIHPPLVVEVRHHSQSDFGGEHADVIYFLDERTNLVVLELGTTDIDDWYPSVVFAWQPEGWTPKWLEPRDHGGEA